MARLDLFQEILEVLDFEQINQKLPKSASKAFRRADYQWKCFVISFLCGNQNKANMANTLDLRTKSHWSWTGHHLGGPLEVVLNSLKSWDFFVKQSSFYKVATTTDKRFSGKISHCGNFRFLSSKIWVIEWKSRRTKCRKSLDSYFTSE